MSLSKWLPCDFEQCHPLLWGGGILVDHWSTISSWFLVWLQVILNETYQKSRTGNKYQDACAMSIGPRIIEIFFKSKVSIWNVNCAWTTAFIFDTWTGVLGKVSRFFETENVSTWGGLEHPAFGFMPNALTYWTIRARHLLSHVVEYWLWRYRYFWSKVNTWNVNCVWATAFTFDTRTVVLGKVSKFLRQKMSRTPNLRINAECSNLLSYQGETFAAPSCWILALVV